MEIDKLRRKLGTKLGKLFETEEDRFFIQLIEVSDNIIDISVSPEKIILTHRQYKALFKDE